jgi:regulator of sigma D
MLKRISKKCVVNVYSGLSWLRTRAHKRACVNMAMSFLDSLNVGHFFIYCHLLKKRSGSCSGSVG